MQLLAMERFTNERYEENAKRYQQEHQKSILKLYASGLIRSFWARSDKPNSVFLLEANSIAEAKRSFAALPLVGKKVFSYSFMPLEAYPLYGQKSKEASENYILVYVSAEKVPMDKKELNAILNVSRSNNASLGVTGVLLYQNGSFLQVLEGNKAQVNNLFDKIATDERHYRIAKVKTFTTDERVFDEWSMGYADITQEELDSLEGFNDFFGQNNSFIDLKEKQVKTLLEAFKEGRWRQKIS
jgi:hypothetical protein